MINQISPANTSKVLVVEDELPLRNILAEEFRQAGIITSTASNGQIGLKKALREKPDFIILDVMMPVMDGSTMLQCLRQDKWGQKVPVIILTNTSSVDTINQTLKNGVDHYLVKADWELKDIVRLANDLFVNTTPTKD